MSPSVEDIAGRLHLSPEETKMLVAHFRSLRNISIIIVLVTGALSFFLGLLIGFATGNSGGGSGYPYLTAPLLSTSAGKWKRSWLLIALFSISAFIFGLSRPVFGDTAIEYSVYRNVKDGL